MKKKSAVLYPMQLEIINHYLVLRSRQFGITVTIGRFYRHGDWNEFPAPTAIGKAYYELLVKVQDLIHQEIQPALNPSSEVKKTLSMNACAKLLNVSLSTLRRLLDKGIIACEKTEGKHRKPSLEGAYAYLKREENE